jgi:hypothetical protein
VGSADGKVISDRIGTGVPRGDHLLWYEEWSESV